MIGASFGALAGVVVELTVLTGWKVFFFLSLPGWFSILLLEGHSTSPSVKTGAVNSLAYSAIGALIGWFWPTPRQGPGHCPKCDYDLTGNVSGVCPECGTEIEKP